MPAVNYGPRLDLKKLRGAIKNNLSRTLHTPVVRIKVLPSKISVVFLVHTARQKYVVKIGPKWFAGSLKREAFCYRMLKKKIKLAKFYGYFPERNMYIPGHEFIILEYVHGTHVNKNKLADRRYYTQIRRIYDALHAFETKQFGWFGRGMVGQNTTWREFILDIDNIESIVASKFISAADFRLFLRRLEYLVKNHDVSPVLLYGDFNPDNFLVDSSGTIVPVDFQSCFSGDFLYDFGIAATYNDKILDYFRPGERSIMILYAARNCLTRMAHAIFAKDVRSTIKTAKLFKRFFSRSSQEPYRIRAAA